MEMDRSPQAIQKGLRYKSSLVRLKNVKGHSIAQRQLLEAAEKCRIQKDVETSY